MTPRLARCPVPACPIRFRTGPDRHCPDHRDQDSYANLRQRAAGFGVIQVAFDGDPDGASESP